MPVSVQGDEKHLGKILLNLLSNAIKFTEQGSVVFKIVCQALKSYQIRFQVKDTGIGIPNERLEEIFLPFQQVGDQRFHEQGTGLCLAISQKLVRMMGNELYVESTPSQGRTFWFELILQEVSEVRCNNIIETGKRNIVGFRGHQRHILIADDYTENRDILKAMLLPLGFILKLSKPITGAIH